MNVINIELVACYCSTEKGGRRRKSAEWEVFSGVWVDQRGIKVEYTNGYPKAAMGHRILCRRGQGSNTEKGKTCNISLFFSDFTG
jgi:hypothetical protein